MSFDGPSSLLRVRQILARLQERSDEGAAFCEVLAENALDAAAAADRRLAEGRSLGPLDGMVVSIKDAFDMAGSRTLAGSRTRETICRASADAAAVGRLRAAGAILIGRTTMSEFAFSGVGLNPHFGAPGNPRDRTRITGGSSSGAAASVGDGNADLALGTDTGGSVRIPASLCGLAGFKPSGGRIPTDGMLPLSPTLDTVGVIGRNVADCAKAFAVLADTVTGVAGMRLRNVATILPAGLMAACSDYVRETFAGVLAKLRHAGIEIGSVDFGAIFSGVDELGKLGTFPSIELASTLSSMEAGRRALIDPKILGRIRRGEDVPASTLEQMSQRRNALIVAADHCFAGVDALMLPTTPIEAPRIEECEDEENFLKHNSRLLSLTSLANILDLPSISLPAPVDGLPVGLMLFGPRGRDEQLLGIAAVLERSLG